MPRASFLGLLALPLVLGATACGSDDSARSRRLRHDGGCIGAECLDATIVPDGQVSGHSGTGGSPPADARVTEPSAPDARVADAAPDAADAADGADGTDAADAAPVCGNGVVEPGEACDDGNQDAGDACQSDCVPSECTSDAQCDDATFCDGTETCVAGQCVPGVPVVIDDAIACTTDLCNEANGAVTHVAVDTACDALDGPRACATTGANAGKVVKVEGVCDAKTGCKTATLVVDDCLDDTAYPTTRSCSTSGTPSIVRHDGTCLAATATCGSTSQTEKSCATAIPKAYPVCSGTAAARNLTWHHNAVPVCSGGASPTCSYGETATVCTATGPTCAAAQVTTRTPTCSTTGGCGVTAATKRCTAGAPICATDAKGSVVRRTYTPVCNAAATGCALPGTSKDTLCAASASTCASGVLTTHAPACAGAGTCGQTTATTGCNDPKSTCTVSPRALLTLTTYTPACNAAGTACGTAVAAAKACTVTTGPSCSRTRARTTYVATCDATAETCGQKAQTENCAALDATACTARGELQTTRGVCSVANGCTQSISTRACTNQVCLDTSRIQYETGCVKGACQTAIAVCPYGCDTSFNQCIIG